MAGGVELGIGQRASTPLAATPAGTASSAAVSISLVAALFHLGRSYLGHSRGCHGRLGRYGGASLYCGRRSRIRRGRRFRGSGRLG